jgi:hypothetical protein
LVVHASSWGELEAIMLHRYLSEDTHEERPLSDTTIVMGIVAVCVLMALALLGAGMIDTGDKITTQPSTQVPVTTQPSTQSPATGENKTP